MLIHHSSVAVRNPWIFSIMQIAYWRRHDMSNLQIQVTTSTHSSASVPAIWEVSMSEYVTRLLRDDLSAPCSTTGPRPSPTTPICDAYRYAERTRCRPGRIRSAPVKRVIDARHIGRRALPVEAQLAARRTMKDHSCGSVDPRHGSDVGRFGGSSARPRSVRRRHPVRSGGPDRTHPADRLRATSPPAWAMRTSVRVSDAFCRHRPATGRRSRHL